MAKKSTLTMIEKINKKHNYEFIVGDFAYDCPFIDKYDYCKINLITGRVTKISSNTYENAVKDPNKKLISNYLW